MPLVKRKLVSEHCRRWSGSLNVKADLGLRLLQSRKLLPYSGTWANKILSLHLLSYNVKIQGFMISAKLKITFFTWKEFYNNRNLKALQPLCKKSLQKSSVYIDIYHRSAYRTIRTYNIVVLVLINPQKCWLVVANTAVYFFLLTFISISSLSTPEVISNCGGSLFTLSFILA